MKAHWKQNRIGLGIMIVLVFGLVPFGAPAANDPDAALMAACPGLSTWADQHPRSEPGKLDEIQPRSPSTLSDELARRADHDQRVRVFFASGQPPTREQLNDLETVDSENLYWLKELVAEHGFPTERGVGKQGVSNAWLLIQHADSDPEFQSSVLDTLIANSTAHNVIKSKIATLYDRVQLAQGRAQRYGTQFTRSEDGVLVLQQPAEDLTGIDVRRATMDLMPLNVYECVLRTTYGSHE